MNFHTFYVTNSSKDGRIVTVLYKVKIKFYLTPVPVYVAFIKSFIRHSNSCTPCIQSYHIQTYYTQQTKIKLSSFKKKRIRVSLWEYLINIWNIELVLRCKINILAHFWDYCFIPQVATEAGKVVHGILENNYYWIWREYNVVFHDTWDTEIPIDIKVESCRIDILNDNVRMSRDVRYNV